GTFTDDRQQELVLVLMALRSGTASIGCDCSAGLQSARRAGDQRRGQQPTLPLEFGPQPRFAAHRIASNAAAAAASVWVISSSPCASDGNHASNWEAGG